MTQTTFVIRVENGRVKSPPDLPCFNIWPICFHISWKIQKRDGIQDGGGQDRYKNERGSIPLYLPDPKFYPFFFWDSPTCNAPSTPLPKAWAQHTAQLASISAVPRSMLLALDSSILSALPPAAHACLPSVLSWRSEDQSTTGGPQECSSLPILLEAFALVSITVWRGHAPLPACHSASPVAMHCTCAVRPRWSLEANLVVGTCISRL